MKRAFVIGAAALFAVLGIALSAQAGICCRARACAGDCCAPAACAPAACAPAPCAPACAPTCCAPRHRLCCHRARACCAESCALCAAPAACAPCAAPAACAPAPCARLRPRAPGQGALAPGSVCPGALCPSLRLDLWGPGLLRSAASALLPTSGLLRRGLHCLRPAACAACAPAACAPAPCACECAPRHCCRLGCPRAVAVGHLPAVLRLPVARLAAMAAGPRPLQLQRLQRQLRPLRPLRQRPPRLRRHRRLQRPSCSLLGCDPLLCTDPTADKRDSKS